MYIQLAQIINDFKDTTPTDQYDTAVDVATAYVALTALAPVMLLALVIIAFVGLLMLFVISSKLTDIWRTLDSSRLESLRATGNADVADAVVEDERKEIQSSLAITSGILIGIILIIVSLVIEEPIGKAAAVSSGIALILASIFIPVFRSRAENRRSEEEPSRAAEEPRSIDSTVYNDDTRNE